jgi:hypothetical protein
MTCAPKPVSIPAACWQRAGADEIAGGPKNDFQLGYTLGKSPTGRIHGSCQAGVLESRSPKIHMLWNSFFAPSVFGVL